MCVVCLQIKEVIRQGVEVPEGQNDLRRMQLRELAQLNGTLRETEGPRCANCSAADHKTWLCPDKPNVTGSIVCAACGGAGHIARDCRARRPGAPPAHHADKVSTPGPSPHTTPTRRALQLLVLISTGQNS